MKEIFGDLIDRQTDRQTDRQRQIDRQTERQTDRWTENCYDRAIIKLLCQNEEILKDIDVTLC